MSIAQNPQTTDSDSDKIDLNKLFGVLIDNRRLIMAVTFVFFCFGIAYAFLATPIYKADALVQVEDKSAGVPGLTDLTDMFAPESSADTEIQIIKSRMVLGHTVDSLNLTVSAEPKYFPLFGKGLARLQGKQEPKVTISQMKLPLELIGKKLNLIYQGNQQFSLLFKGDELLKGRVGQLAHSDGASILVSEIDATADTEFTVTKSARLVTISDLRKEIKIAEQGKKTGILRLTLEGDNQNRIQAILENITQYYLMQNVDRTSANAEQSLQFLRKHLPVVKKQLNASEAKLDQYKSKSDSINLELEAKSVLESVVTVDSQLNELKLKESDIAQNYTKSHPIYVSLLQKRKTLEAEKKRLENSVSKMPKTQQEVIRLRRDVEVNQAIYLQLVNKVQELKVMKASEVGNVRILDNAASLEKPVKPMKLIVIAIALLVGGFLSIAYVLVSDAFHRGVENPDEIEEIGLPVYACIPVSSDQIKIEKKRRSGKELNVEDSLLTAFNPADLSIEALRSLRTSLHFGMMDAKNNIIMISGPSPDIGKSFVSSNMAAVISKSGQKALIIDADMRKGKLEEHFAESNTPGLSSYLAGKTKVSEIIKKTGVENLDFVGRGDIPPNPSELLMHPRLKELLDWASENYDIVIIDTPPILAVTDPAIIGANVGTTLLVGYFGKTSVKEIEVTKKRFEQNGIEVKGFIFNAVVPKASSAYGYYNYSYES
ncbi:polysaccharide biosynthesis tyrosine autokinase [Vibrio profundum]|uniref:polysaccharide biosynthesis tyrosine autokinase n=1 Tax=Vibrio profundum TaxID=2910247 RepID=UPI003D0F437D